MIQKSRGIQGIEASIILISVVIVAAFLAYSMINVGTTSTGEVKAVINSGLIQASSSLQASGTILGLLCLEGGTGCGDHESIGMITYPIKLGSGDTPVNLHFSNTVVKYLSNTVEFDDIYNGSIDVEIPLVHVLDTANSRGQVLDANGNYLSQFNGMGFGNGIDVTKSGIIYVADTSNNRIQIYDSAGNNPINFGIFGTAEGQFDQPWRVAHDSETDLVIVSEIGNNRVQIFDSSGNFLRMFGWGVDTGAAAFEICTAGCQAGSTGFNPGQFWIPIGVSTDGTNIYVADLVPTRVQVFDFDGNYLSNFPTAGNPIGLEVKNNRILVSLLSNDVEVFALDGTSQFQFATGAGPFDVDADSSGNIYVIENGPDHVQVYDPNGNPLYIIGGPGAGDGQFNNPNSLAITSYDKSPGSAIGLAAGRQLITTGIDSIYGPSASNTGAVIFFPVSKSQTNSILEQGEHGVIGVALSPQDRSVPLDKIRIELLTASGGTYSVSIQVPTYIQAITELG